jgi:hypothetical protein
MNGIIRRRGWAALIASAAVLAAVGVGTASASFSSSSNGSVNITNGVTKSFAFIGKNNSKTVNVVNIDKLTINARCNGSGSPIVFAFSSATNGDLFGRVFDGHGRLQIVHNSSFSKGNPGVRLNPTSNDFDSTGTVVYENSSGQAVTVNIAMDNATTLNKLNVCTVYGSVVAT